MTEQQDGFSSGNFQPIGKLSAEDIRTGNIDRAEVAHDYTRENLRPETLPIFIKLIWQDLAWENILLPKQGMDHAVILLEGVRSDEGEFADMVPNRVIVRAPYTEAYRLQASRESGVIAALGHRSNARLPQTVRQAHVPRRFTGNQRRIRVTLLSVIDGTPLDANVWQQMNAEQQELVVEQLGSLLAAMHTMNSSLPPASNLESWWADGPGQSDATGVHEVGGVPISPATEGEAHELNYTERTLPGKHEVMRRRMVEVLKPELSAAEYARAEGIMAEVDDMLARTDLRRCLTHGDLSREHLLWLPDQGVGVLDFSDMTVGDPALDYAHFEMIAPGLTKRIFDHAGVAAEDVADPQVVFEDEDLLKRAKLYKRWDNLFLLIDHYRTGRSPRVEI